MLRKTIRQMLTAQVLSALTVSLCLLIDNIMIGNFIGVGGLTAYGLASPLLILIGAVASMLSAGVQVVCSRSLGQGRREETDSGFSSAVAVVVVLSAVIIALVLLLREPVAVFLGAADDALRADTGNYLMGFAAGTLASMGALILVPFLLMAGKSQLLIYSVLGMTAADIALDYIFSVVLKLGMLGMGLASSISYYVALVIGGSYFCSRKCVFHFSFAGISGRKILELFRGGIPTVVNMASTVALTFILNRVLLQVGGSAAVAAYSVVCTIGNSANCISTGSGGVALTLSGMFYHEEDRTSLVQQLAILCRYALIMGLVMTCLIELLAPVFVRLFIPEAGGEQELAIFGARLFACGLTFCCITNAVRGTWQGCGNVLLTEITSVIEGLLLPAAAAVIFGAAFGTKGVWLFFAFGEAATLLLVWLYTARRSGSMKPSAEHALLLPDGFGVPAEDLLEADIRSIDDVMDVSRRALDFCLAHGQTRQVANRIGVCIEEMGTNTVKYGFHDGRPHHLSVLVQHKGERWILRFRDDCPAFDPVSHIPTGEGEDNLGIRLVMGMSRQIVYTYSLSLNNLTISIW